MIAVGAGKGGTGKTTFSINLGVALSENGYRTVLMDADASMSNLSTYIGMDPEKMQTTLHDVLAGEAEPDKAVYKVFNERLRVVPSGLSIEGFLKMDRELLKDVIEYFSRDADFIVIDTPAGYNKEVALSLVASDHLILVLNPDEGSMTDGLKVQEMASILGVNVLGIVLNRFDMKCPQFSKAQIEEHFGTPVIAMLPDDPNVRRKDKTPVVLASPASRMAAETYQGGGYRLRPQGGAEPFLRVEAHGRAVQEPISFFIFDAYIRSWRSWWARPAGPMMTGKAFFIRTT